MSKTEKLKNEILDSISLLFSDTNAGEQEQIDALEEIVSLCEDNIEVLKAQIGNE